MILEALLRGKNYLNPLRLIVAWQIELSGLPMMLTPDLFFIEETERAFQT